MLSSSDFSIEGPSVVVASRSPIHSRSDPRDAKGPRITYSVVSIFCMLLLATMLGSRVHVLTERSHEQPLNFIRVLVFLLYFFAIAYVATAAVLQSGLDLSTLASCRAAIYVCLVFYFGSKVLVQLFLVERAHAVRYRLKRRQQDWVWLASVAIIILGFGSISGLAFAYPIAELAGDQKCRIGVPTKVTLPLLVYDISINMALTGVFVALLRPLLAFQRYRETAPAHQDDDHNKPPAVVLTTDQGGRVPSTDSSVELAASNPHSDSSVAGDPNVRALKALIYKSLIGAVAMLVPTIINLGLLFRWKGHEQGWLCFTLCTLDVTWSVAVLHYLTVDRREENAYA